MLGGDDGDKAWIDEVVTTVGLADRLKHRPSELSGGQQQRVAVARALAGKPDIIFADEPTGNLDSRTGAEILDFMRRAVREYGQTIVMVTHDPGAASYADRVVFLNDGKHRRRDGRADERARARPHEGRSGTEPDDARAPPSSSPGAASGPASGASSPSPSPSSSASASSSARSCSPTACARRSTTCSRRSARTSTCASARRSRSATTTSRSSATRSRPRCCRPSRASTASPRPSRCCSASPRSSRRDGEVVTTQGAPTLGVGWTGNEELSGLTIKDGAAPSGIDQVAIDKATADREDIAVGDEIQVITDTGTYPFTVTALVGLGDSDGFAGATLAAWDVATAQQVTGAGDQFDGIDIQLADGRRSGDGHDRARAGAAGRAPRSSTGRRSSRRPRPGSTRSSAPSATACSASPSSPRSSAPSSSTTCSRSRSASACGSWR